jgi:putative nucleotidyltransferase with HDIG domain
LLSDKIHINATLQELSENWKDLIESLPYSIFIIDTNCNVITANNAALNLLKKDTESRNIKCYSFLHNADGPIEECPMIKTLKSGSSEQREVYEPHIGRHLNIHTAPVLHNKKIIGVIHSVIDVTEQKSSEASNSDLIDIFARSVTEMKTKEIRAQKGRDAFLNMLLDINESYNDLEDLFLKLILVMVNALDAKSPWTKGHSERVSMYAEQIAKEMFIDEDEIKDIKLAGLLHDIGKIGTYDYLLDKPGRLTKEEFDIVKKHPDQGADILKEIKQLRDIMPYIKYHHEKLDGNGYPYKLKGENIPLGARILHVADSFDSMTSDRPYRPAPGIKYALSELEKYKGTQFDHDVVETFLKILNKSEI